MFHSMYLLFLIFVSNSLFFNIAQAISVSIPRSHSSSRSDSDYESRCRYEDERRREYLERREAESRAREEQRAEELRAEARREAEVRAEAWRAECRRLEELKTEDERRLEAIRLQEEAEYEERRRREYEEEALRLKKIEEEEADKRYWEEREEALRQEQILLEQNLKAESLKKEQPSAAHTGECKTEIKIEQQENIKQARAEIRLEESRPIENNEVEKINFVEENHISNHSVENDVSFSVHQQTIKKFKDINFIKRLFKQRLLRDISAYDIALDSNLFSSVDIDELDVHLLKKIDSSEFVYIPAQNGVPACMYTVSEDGESSFLHILSQEEEKALFHAFMVTPGIAGPLIGGSGIATGGLVPIIVGGGLTIGWIIKIGIPLLKDLKIKFKKGNGGSDGSSDSDNRKGGGGGNNNNDDDDDEKIKRNKRKVKTAEKTAQEVSKKKHPYGIYEENPKHNKNSRNGVGKPPRDGQSALDESIKAKDGQRVAIQDRKIIALKEHELGKWHGYIEEDFYKLDRAAQQALVDAGWVRSIKSGKIIKK